MPIVAEKVTLRARRIVPDVEFAIPILPRGDLYLWSQMRVFGLVLAFGKSVVLLQSVSFYPLRVKGVLSGPITLGPAESMLVHPLDIGDRRLWIHGWYKNDLVRYLKTRS